MLPTQITLTALGLWLTLLWPLSGQSFSRADSLRGALRHERTCYDVFFYDLYLKPDITKKFLTGKNVVYFHVKERTRVIQIDLQVPMSINRIHWNKLPVAVVREHNACFLNFSRWLEPGEMHAVEIEFSGPVPVAANPPWDGGFVFSKDSKGKPWVGVACQHLGASSWWPCKDHLSDEPDSMRIAIDVPFGLMAVSNGQLRQKIPMEESVLWEWFVSYPINTYNVTLNIADYVHFSDTLIQERYKLPLNYYVLRENLSKAKKHFKQVKPILRCYEDWMGPYPFSRDGYALVETSYAGMEHQSAIAYGNRYTFGYLGYDRTMLGLDFDFIIAHETAHEYWGNNISIRDNADLWIHEAFATYSEALLVECLYGPEYADVYVQSWRMSVLNQKPMQGPYHVNAKTDTDVYYKGALMLHTLRKMVGNDELWKQMWRVLQAEFGLKTVESREIIDFMSKFLSRDLGWFFDHYLRWSGPPVFEYSIRKKEQELQMGYRWQGVYTDFRLPVFISRDGRKWEEIFPDTQMKWMPVPDRFIDIDTARAYFLVRKLK